MFGSSGQSSTGIAAPHTPTLGWTVGIIIVALIAYHFIAHRKG